MGSIKCSRNRCSGSKLKLLRDFLRYPGVFKKSVRGKMCLFYRCLKLCPQENLLKMLPEGSYILGPNNSRIGSFLKILKVPFYCQSPWQQLCPRAYFPKMAPQEVKFKRILGKIDKMFENRF